MEIVLKQILSELQNVNTRLGSLEEGQAEMRNDISGLKSDVSLLKSEQQEMRKDISGLKSDVSSLKSEQQDMRKDISNLQADIAEMKEQQKQNQKEIITTLGSYMDKVVAYVDDKTEALNKRVYKVETDIERLLKQ
ncbi:hypothetical protein [Bacillus sp. CGMCC 1.16541]|uniref:hypothetical protein n=1 Tax=Bacillus sp. CGMCC 1.16541 TaxID=2185143 RepID=UPI000D72F141|nr:hypothetical protein [Bacillus sp. CGMCC 1.16541]